MTLEVKLTSTGGHDGTARLQVNGPDGLFGTALFQVGDCAEVNHVLTITTGPLPNVVKAYTRMGLSWRVDPPLNWPTKRIRNTSHFVYVTLGTPSGSLPTNRRLNFACYSAAGAGNTDAAALAIWNQLDNEPPVFDLQQGGCPSPCPWSLMVPGNPGQCIDLATLMQHACGVIGVSASIGYVYATTDSVNFSTSQNAFQTRAYQYAPGEFRTEELLFFASGGLNNWEAVCVVNNRYYAVKETHGSNAVQVLKDIVCPNELTGAHQRWVFPPGGTNINTQDQYPAPLPGTCP